MLVIACALTLVTGVAAAVVSLRSALVSQYVVVLHVEVSVADRSARLQGRVGPQRVGGAAEEEESACNACEDSQPAP